MVETLLIAAGFLVVAVVYSSVGHGGASGYLAVMALAGLAPEELRPTALTLNVIVSATAAMRFGAAGHFRFRLFWPFAIASIPAAFAAGRWLTADPALYRWLLGAVLIYAAVRLVWSVRGRAERPMRNVAVPIAIIVGAVIGMISGLIGIGGGIFLSPLIVLLRWGKPQEAAAVAAVFIFANSLAGLIGLTMQTGDWPMEPQRLGVFAVTVLVGGLIGSGIGARKLNQGLLNVMLAVVLVIAAGKLLIG
jgi:uncharacterized protein